MNRLSLTLLIALLAMITQNAFAEWGNKKNSNQAENTMSIEVSPIFGSAQGEGFKSEVDAVLAATNLVNPTSIAEDTEFIGAILKKENAFFYTLQKGNQGQDEVSLHFRYPKHYQLVAFWHTHGAPAAERLYFSDMDTQVTKETGKPFYLADHSGDLKVFRPNSPTMSSWAAKRSGLPAMRGFAKGHVVKNRFGKLVRIRTSTIHG